MLSCIEAYPGHQRIFLACGEMLWIFRSRQKSLEAKLRQKTREKKLFAWVTIKTLPYQKLRIKSLWAPRVIEPLFWKRYIDDVFFLWKTSLKIESLNRGKGK